MICPNHPHAAGGTVFYSFPAKVAYRVNLVGSYLNSKRLSFTVRHSLIAMAIIAFLIAYVSQQRSILKLSEQVNRFQHLEKWLASTPSIGTDTYYFYWETIVDTPNMKLIRYSVQSADPHFLRCTTNDHTMKIPSAWRLDKRFYESTAIVTVIRSADSSVEIFINQELGPFEYAFQEQILSKSELPNLTFPDRTQGGGTGSSAYAIPPLEAVQNLFGWNGKNLVALDAVFQSRRKIDPREEGISPEP